MEQATKDLQEWAKATMQAKVQELEAGMRFILRNQKANAFYDGDDDKNENRGRQGMMFIQIDDNVPTLYVNWDEVNVFDDQKELFEKVFEGNFTSDKLITITGVKL
jgi:hypothetical protein